MNSSSSAWQAAGEPSAMWKIAQLCSRSRIVAVGAEDRVGEVALVGLDDRQLAHPIEQRRVAVDAVGHLLADPVTELAPSRGEDLVEQVVATDSLDRGEEARGQGVVVRREEVLRVGRDVVQVARPADAVADGLAGDEVGGLERAELLEHAGPAGPDPPGQLVGRARAVEPQAEQQLATQAGRAAGRSSAGHRRHDGGLGPTEVSGMGHRLAPAPAASLCRCTLGAMDLDLSPEHVLLRDTIRDFMLTEVAPVIDEHERERRFPSEIVRRIGELGWLGIPFPEDEGGAGLDTLAYAIAVEEIGRVWGSLGLIVAAHTSLGCGPLHLAGTPEQQARFLVPMARGEVIGAYGLTEPGAGSDSGGTRTTARSRGRPGRRVVGPRRSQAIHHQRRPGGHLHRHRPDRDARRRQRRDQRVHRPRRHAGVHDRTT